MAGKRAYRPHLPGDLNIGDVIKFKRSGGNIQVGQVRYIGHLPSKSEPVIGVETEYASQSSQLTLKTITYSLKLKCVQLIKSTIILSFLQ